MQRAADGAVQDSLLPGCSNPKSHAAKLRARAASSLARGLPGEPAPGLLRGAEAVTDRQASSATQFLLGLPVGRVGSEARRDGWFADHSQERVARPFAFAAAGSVAQPPQLGRMAHLRAPAVPSKDETLFVLHVRCGSKRRAAPWISGPVLFELALLDGSRSMSAHERYRRTECQRCPAPRSHPGRNLGRCGACAAIRRFKADSRASLTASQLLSC